jgi:hypothetical protein
MHVSKLCYNGMEFPLLDINTDSHASCPMWKGGES